MKFNLAFIMLLLPVCLFAQPATSPYAGEEQREIKALAPQEIAGYRAGAGMGFAKAAELNHYPGPKHVMELAEKLALTPEQNAAVKESYNRMRQSAVQLGEQIIELEKALNDAFAAGDALPDRIKSLVTSIAELKGQLRFVHLRAHLEMREVLNQKQIQQYDQLRGYGSNTGGGHSGHEHHH